MLELLLAALGGGKNTSTTWTKLNVASAPAGIDQMAVVTYKADVYFLGGFNNSTGAESAACYKYSIDNKAFTTLAPLPVGLRSHRAVAGSVAGAGKIYVWGGQTAAGVVTAFYEYTISTNTWATLTLPPAASSPGALDVLMTNIGTDIYILGGTAGNASADGSPNMVKYDPIAKTWTARAAFPNAITNGCMNGLDDKLWVAFGNYNSGAANQNDLMVYDPVANTWAVRIANITGTDGPRVGAKSALFGNTIQYWGGTASNNIAGYDFYSNTFASSLGTMPPEPKEGNGFLAQNKFYSLGSKTGTEFWVYDPYFGKAKPNFVIIPYQEFYSATTFGQTFGVPGSSGSTLGPEGLNWMLMRFDNQMWILPQKPLRKGSDLNSGLAFINGSPVSVGTIRYTMWGTPNIDALSNGNYAKLYGRVSAVFTPNIMTGVPKLARFTNATLGFTPYSYDWTAQANAAFDTIAVGGTGPAATTASFNNSSGRADLRPFIKIDVVGTFPW